MIPQCPPKECCNPDLFNYSLNLKDPVFNQEVTLFLFCPPEWNCSGPEISVTIPPGKWPVIPHNGDGDEQCEADRFAVRDAITQLLSLIDRIFLIGNDEVTVTCDDFGLEGDGSFTLPENTVFEQGMAGFAGPFTEELATVLQVCPIDFTAVQRVLERAQPFVTNFDAAKAKANERARQLAEAQFLWRVANGFIVCSGAVPVILTAPDDTFIGEFSMPLWGPDEEILLSEEPGVYRFEFVNGLSWGDKSSGFCPTCPSPLTTGCGEPPIWRHNCRGTMAWRSTRDTGVNSQPAPTPLDLLTCDTDPAVALAGTINIWNNHAPVVAKTIINHQFSHRPLHWTGIGGGGGFNSPTNENPNGPMIVRVRRTTRWISNMPVRLRIKDFASIESGLVMCGGAFDFTDLPWSGQWESRTPISSGYFYNIGPNLWSLNGKNLHPARTRVMHVTDDPVTPSGTSWMISIADSDFRMGYWRKPTGDNPIGVYRFTAIPPPGFALPCGLKSDVVAIATAPMPANTRTGNVLTASANGMIPAIDGVAVNVGNRVLLTAEGDPINNGIYTVTNAGSGATPWELTRATDADEDSEVFQRILCRAAAGNAHFDTFWQLATSDPIEVNTTPQNWIPIPMLLEIESF